jgi:hypothetical protein
VYGLQERQTSTSTDASGTGHIRRSPQFGGPAAG